MPEPWSTDAAFAAAILAALVHEIDRRSRDEQEDLLADFQLVAWPSRWAQNQ